MSQETPYGIFYIALPEATLELCKRIESKKGISIAEIISIAIMEYAQNSGVTEK